MPYVKKVRETVGDSAAALVIMDNFKGQVTKSVSKLLEQNNIHVCLLMPNTTDLLQPMDISVNKLAKEYLKRQFEQWYSGKVMEQLEGRDLDDLEAAKLQPINLRMPTLKEIGAQWLVEMAEYISENLQFIVNSFIRSGITRASGGTENEMETDIGSDGSDSNFSDLSDEELEITDSYLN